jgi:peptide/nickel transport system ATP-binding protein
MTEALLSVKNLSIGIRRRLPSCENQLLSSVEDVSFDIMPGEILGIVGESGSGKSLTALSIPGLLGENEEVSGGAILFSRASDDPSGVNAPRNLLTLPEKELQTIRGKEISMIFQEPFSSLNPLMKVGDQIAETLELHGEKDRDLARSRAMELMERLKLPEPEKLAKAYPHRLSGGMCQRVMIAMAIICRPRLLIADEPTTALDQNTQSQILSLLKEINQDLGTSILLISHNLEVIKSICSRVLVMYSGRILEEGKTCEVFSRPAHEYTRGLINSIPNRVNKGKDLKAIPGKIPSLEEGRPQGCPFHPRCGKAGPLCKGEFPAARPLSGGHSTRCILDYAIQEEP